MQVLFSTALENVEHLHMEQQNRNKTKKQNKKAKQKRVQMEINKVGMEKKSSDGLPSPAIATMRSSG